MGLASIFLAKKVNVMVSLIREHAMLVCALAASVCLLIPGALYFNVRQQASPLYRAIGDVPKMPVAIVFGAGVGTTILTDRVQTAVSLYKNGKVRKILMSGDNGHVDYDEPKAMKTLAVAQGVPFADVVCDYAGFRTYDSLYRARNIFDVRQAILVTQAFHLPRAMYIARHLGLSVVGIDAARHSYGFEQYFYELREIAAIETACFDVFTQRKPKFLGKKESLGLGSEV